MSTAERRQRHRASLRREILDAATQLFVEEGSRGVTMRRVAERIEYSPTTIYLHFKDKNELLAAVCEETFSRLAGKLERLRKTASSPLVYLREGLRTFVDFGLAHPAQYAIAFMSPSPRPGQEDAAFEHASSSRVFDALRQGVHACAENGDIHTANVDMTAQALWAAAHGLTSLFIAMPGFALAGRPALIDHAIDTLLAGLKMPAASPRTPVAAQSKKWDFFD
jgi:AcrR family transcriptional regulator